MSEIDNVTIKKALLSDVPLIRDIALNTWRVTYEGILSKEQIDFMLEALYSEKELTSLIVEREQTFLLLMEEKPKAFVSYSQKEENSNIFKLHKIYILPASQGKGLGRRLIKEVMYRVREAGKDILELNVNRKNKAVKFYEKMGFRIIREEDIPIGSYWMNDYIMQINVWERN